jgi:pimeloyl-ACP methyl ester carboxylesterase
MTDFLLVHDAGHGSWSWGRVWGYLTAPVEHPPRLYGRSAVGKVLALDLPGHAARPKEDVSGLSLDDFVSAVTNEVKSQGLHDLVMAGHGVAAPVLLQAAARLDEPPKRIVLFSGVIPRDGKSVLDTLPRLSRLGFKTMARMNRVAKKDLRLPNAVITNIYCNGMDPFDVVQIVGRFRALPPQLFQTPIYLDDLAPGLPMTYVPLWRDRLVSLDIQQQMAGRLGSVEVVPDLDACHEVMTERPKQVADILLKYV